MDEFEIKPVISREALAKQGASALAYLGGGVFLLVLVFGARLPFLGIVLSLAALVIGIAALSSRTGPDKKPGLAIGAAGILALVMRFGIPRLRPFAGFALSLGGIGLIAAGIWKGVQYLIGLKSRQ